MLKPRLLTNRFVQKIVQERNERSLYLKNIFLSKSFYIFIGVLTLCLLLFLIFRYFDKRDKIREEEYKKIVGIEPEQRYREEEEIADEYKRETVIQKNNDEEEIDPNMLSENVRVMNSVLEDKNEFIQEIKFDE
jgi:hypothetical protein